MAETVGRNTEKAVNHEIGNILRKKHPRWKKGCIETEKTGMLKNEAGKQVDIVICHPGGVPVVIETEFAPARTVTGDACSRLGKTLSHNGSRIEQAIALRIPEDLKATDQGMLTDEIQSSRFEYCVFSALDDDNTHERWPEKGWIVGGVDDLAAFIEHTALSENRIEQGMEVLAEGVGQAASILRAACGQSPDTLRKIAESLNQEDGEQTSRMGMAILANAISFHIAIAGAEDIKTIGELRNLRGSLKKNIIEEWTRIRDEINYWPIFDIALKVLAPIRNGTAQKILDRLTEVAGELDSLGATSQHDLSGRMFQRLITDRKFLATFYTMPRSAALLAEIAVSRLHTDWSDKNEITKLRVADFACGTGALLNASYSSMMSRYRRMNKDDSKIHHIMMEKVIVGTDIMPAATHLTASILSSSHPTKTFKNTQIITLKYGEKPTPTGKDIFIGALDLIVQEDNIFPVFRTEQEHHSGTEGSIEKPVDLPHESFDLVIMNPPFTQPTNHSGQNKNIPLPIFAAFGNSTKVQNRMNQKLKKVQRQKPDSVGNGYAGLATNFMDIADAKVKRGGGSRSSDPCNVCNRRFMDVNAESLGTIL